MKINYFKLLMLALTPLYSYSQNKVQVIPPSPDAGQLGKYGQYPVDLSSGLVKIEVPLYEISTKEIKVPISVSYHASGIKVNDVASNIGLGWVLNAGGVITRSIRGRADDEVGGFLKTTNNFLSRNEILTSNDRDKIFNYMYSRSEGTLDNESDRYFYNVTGMSGSFVYDIEKKIQQIPFSDNKIEGSIGSGYTITSDNGTRYLFDIEKEYSRINSGSPNITSIYLSKIISPSSVDTIYFKYQVDGSLYSDIYTSYKRAYGSPPSWVTQEGFGNTLTYYMINDTRILSNIKFPGGSVEFTITDDRKDKRKNRVNGLVVKDLNGNKIKEIIFKQSYFETTSPQPPDYSNRNNNVDYRLKLDSVLISDVKNTDLSKYGFSYNQTKLPIYWSGGSRSDWRSHYGQDLWGYYNGITNNEFFMPTMPGSPGANRSISTSHAQAGILIGIKYPTGGSSTFEYESNNSGTTVGGLRVKKITDYTGNSLPAATRSFEYISGYLTEYNAFLFSTNNYNYNYIVTNTNTTSAVLDVFTSDASVPLGNNAGNAVFYRNVTEKILSSDGNNGKIDYEYEFTADSSYFTSVSGPSGFGGFKVRYPYYVVGNSWARGPLKKQIIYKSNPDQSYSPIKIIENVYDRFRWRATKIGSNIFANFKTYGSTPTPADAPSARNLFQFFDVDIQLGVKRLGETRITTFSTNGADSSYEFSKRFYDAINRDTYSHMLPTRISSIKSDGSKEVVSTSYANDYASGISFIDNMKANNLINYPIEQVRYLEVGTTTTILSGSITKYLSGGKGLVDQVLELEAPRPVALASFKFSNRSQGVLPSGGTATAFSPFSSYRPILTYGNNYDDKGNPLQVTAENGAPTSYLWAYQGQYPVSEVNNAVQSDIAYASFEGSEKGNWSYNGSINPVSRFTGKLVYILNNSSPISKSGLSSGKTYMLSCWVMGTTAPTVTGGTMVSSGMSEPVNGWSQFRYVFKGATSVSLSYPSTGGVPVDEVRLHPIDASMTTYTYDPLVGMTSSTDASGHTTYYEHDGFGRLKTVKDQDRKLEESYDYKYRNQ